MDHIRILKRAVSITASYRALWVFGILLALTAGGSGGGGNGGGTGTPGSGGFPEPQLSPEFINALLIAGAVLLCVILVLAIVATIVRYVSETALLRMVDQHEATGVKVGARQGFRLGWSRAAWRLFWLDLVVGLTTLVTFLVLFGLAAAPLLLWLIENDLVNVLGTLLAVGLAVVVIFVLIVTVIALSLLGQLWHRAVVLEDLGVSAALRRGWQLLRGRLGDVLIMGLILFGLGLAWAFILVPIAFLLLVVAGVAGGLPALLAYALTSLLTQGAAPWIAAAVIGVPVIIVVLGVPLTVLGGLATTFQSSVWTLTYRELLALEAAPPAPAADDAPPALPMDDAPPAAA